MIVDLLRTLFASAMRRDAEHRAAVERAHKAARAAEVAALEAREAVDALNAARENRARAVEFDR